MCHLFETFHAGFHTPDNPIRALKPAEQKAERKQQGVLFIILFVHKLR